MLLNYRLAISVAECTRAVETPKFRPFIMPAIRDLDVPGDFSPGDRAPVLLRRSEVLVDTMRWGWIDKVTKQEFYFSPADRSYGRRCLVETTEFHCEIDDGSGVRLVRFMSATGGPLFLGAVWHEPSSVGPKAFTIMLCKAGPDMPQGSVYQPVLIDPKNAPLFIDHMRRGQHFQDATASGILRYEMLDRLRELTFSPNDPFRMDRDPRFFAASA